MAEIMWFVGRGTTFVAAFVGSLACPPLASAQSRAAVPPPDAEAAQTARAVDDSGEIVVTARRRIENVQDVPDSIAVLTGAQLESAGIGSIDSAADLVPNLSLVDSQDGGVVAINIRGVGQVRNGEPPVAINVDGVQLISTDLIKQALFDVDRLEILKGPQGALYGRNAIGGAINIITRRPGNDFEGRLQAEYGNGSDRRLIGSVSGPVVRDKIAFRVAGDYQDFDGVIPNVTLRRDVDVRKDLNLRGRLLATPSSNLTIDVRGAFGRLRSGASWYIPLPDGQPNNTSIPVQANEFGRSKRDSYEGSVKIDYDTGPLLLTSISAISDVDFYFFQDLDWTPLSNLAGYQTRDVRSFSQEFRATSPSDQPLRWVAGAYYLDAKRRIDTVAQLGAAFGFTPYVDVPFTRTTGSSTALAGYGQLNWDVASNVELTFGVRYDHEKLRQVDRLGFTDRRTTTFDQWQPKVSLKYELSESAMIYATAARGFRSGGFNPPSPDFPEIYSPERTTGVELGAKTSAFGNRITFNIAGFFTEYDNQHVFILKLANQGIVNIAKSEILGFEAELKARPVTGLQLAASLGLLDTKIKNFDSSALYRGNQIPLTYGWSYALSGQYKVPIGQWSLTPRVEYTARGDNFWHVDNDDKQEDLHLVDIRLTAEFGDISVYGYANNVFDKKYTEEFFAQQFSGLFSDIRYPGTPRRYGVGATIRF